MGKSHDDVAKYWVEGKYYKGKSMFAEEGVIYSWGNHFPIAKFISEDKVLFNIDKYSFSTSKHQYIVSLRIPKDIEVITCSTSELLHNINYPDEPIIIKVEKGFSEYGEIVEQVKKYFKNRGIKTHRITRGLNNLKKMLIAEVL